MVGLGERNILGEATRRAPRGVGSPATVSAIAPPRRWEISMRQVEVTGSGTKRGVARLSSWVNMSARGIGRH